MILATENVGISCMNVPKQSQLFKKNEKLLLWCAQVTRQVVEQVILKNVFLIWEMHQSNWEKL